MAPARVAAAGFAIALGAGGIFAFLRAPDDAPPPSAPGNDGAVQAVASAPPTPPLGPIPALPEVGQSAVVPDQAPAPPSPSPPEPAAPSAAREGGVFVPAPALLGRPPTRVAATSLLEAAAKVCQDLELRLGVTPRPDDPHEVLDADRIGPTLDGQASVIVEGRLAGSLTVDGSYKWVLFEQAPAPEATIRTETYATLLFPEGLRGKVVAGSYTTVIVEGAMEGEIECESYTAVVLRGPLRGVVRKLRHEVLHLQGDALQDGAGRIEVEVGQAGVVAPTIVVHGPVDLERLLERLTVVLDLGLARSVELRQARTGEAREAVERDFVACELIAPVTLRLQGSGGTPGASYPRPFVQLIVE